MMDDWMNQDGIPTSVVDIHEMAILKLMEGEETEALMLLHRALDGSRAQMRQIGPEVGQSMDESCDAVICPVSLEGVVVNRGNPSEISAPDNYFRMCRTVYSIEGEDSDSEALAPEVTVVLLYNLAVLHQEAGFATSDYAAVDRAQKLYELARSVLSQTKQIRRQLLSMDLTELELAILNNLGHTYCFFCKYEQTVSVREALRSLMADLGPNQLATESFDFFQSSVVTAHQRDHGTAPAA